jgi:protein TonB
MLGGFFHHNEWGNSGTGGAIQVNLVSNALPLPSDQPPNQNVLATETPSEAPAEQSKITKQAADDKSIAIQGKPAKPKPVPRNVQRQPQPTQMAKAQFGEQSGSQMQRSTMAQGGTTNGPVTVANGDFGTRFGWYVDVIKRKVDQNWLRPEVDPRTPKGSVVTIYFRVNRQGVPSNFRINSASSSSTLNTSCLRATQRVDTFGPLPAGSNDQWLDVTYDCTY